jgi:ATP-dependent Lhr-like helicase
VFAPLKVIAVDEWHELLGSKRGVQVELALSRIMGVKGGGCSIIGISATIGNLEQAKEVLLSAVGDGGFIVRARIDKPIDVESILPDEIEKYPWAGHLGLKLIDKVIPIL